MKYIIFKSKLFGDTKINLSEAIQGKKIGLNEDITKDNLTGVQKLIDDEFGKKYLPQIKKQIEDTVAKAMDSKENERKIEEIVANCLVQLYKQLWSKRSFWVSGIKNKSN